MISCNILGYLCVFKNKGKMGKVFSFIVIFVLLFSLVACGSSQKEVLQRKSDYLERDSLILIK